MIYSNEKGLYQRDIGTEVFGSITKENKVTFKKLLPHQIDFANAIDQTFSAIVGGYGSGKTRALIPRYCNLSVKRNGEVRFLVIAPSYSLLQDIDIPLFINWLNKYDIPYNHKKSRRIIEIFDVFRGEIWFRSGDKPEKIVGFECTDFCIDEFDTLKLDQQEKVWNKSVARARSADDPTGGVVTTPEGYRYTHELFVENEVGKLIQADTRDNYHLPKSYIENLLSQYDERLIEQYIEGGFVSLAGADAYYAYSEDVLFDYDPRMAQNTVYIGMDFNVNPMTAVCAYYSGGKLYVFDEIFLRNSNTEKMINKIEQKFPNQRIVVAPDMTGDKRQTSAKAGITDLILLQQAGFEIMGNTSVGNPPERDRKNCLNTSLDRGLVYIERGNKQLKKDFKQLKVNDAGEIETEDSEREHISTALGYLVWRLFKTEIYDKRDKKVSQL